MVLRADDALYRPSSDSESQSRTATDGVTNRPPFRYDEKSRVWSTVLHAAPVMYTPGITRRYMLARSSSVAAAKARLPPGACTARRLRRALSRVWRSSRLAPTPASTPGPAIRVPISILVESNQPTRRPTAIERADRLRPAPSVSRACVAVAVSQPSKANLWPMRTPARAVLPNSAGSPAVAFMSHVGLRHANSAPAPNAFCPVSADQCRPAAPPRNVQRSPISAAIGGSSNERTRASALASIASIDAGRSAMASSRRIPGAIGVLMRSAVIVAPLGAVAMSIDASPASGPRRLRPGSLTSTKASPRTRTSRSSVSASNTRCAPGNATGGTPTRIVTSAVAPGASDSVAGKSFVSCVQPASVTSCGASVSTAFPMFATRHDSRTVSPGRAASRSRVGRNTRRRTILTSASIGTSTSPRPNASNRT